jgi:hypothetical protein
MAELKKHYPCWLDSVPVNSIPVQVVGTDFYKTFADLAEAQQTFPELNPYQHSQGFTWGMRGELKGQPALRFETWQAYEVLSQ